MSQMLKMPEIDANDICVNLIVVADNFLVYL